MLFGMCFWIIYGECECASLARNMLRCKVVAINSYVEAETRLTRLFATFWCTEGANMCCFAP